jgi:phospholipid transport system substrate-binding protein
MTAGSNVVIFYWEGTKPVQFAHGRRNSESVRNQDRISIHFYEFSKLPCASNLGAKGMNVILVGKPRIFKILISATLICLWASQTAVAVNPEEVIKSGTDQVLKILSEYHENTRARREEIRAVVDEYFDVEGMAKCVLGSRWNSESPDKQQEFIKDFSRLLINTIDKIGNYANGEITYNRKQMGQDRAVVEALLTGNWLCQIGIDYYLYLKNGNWKVHDIAVQGISIVNKYHCQFAEVLSKNSFEDLLKQLERTIAQS